MTESPPKSPTWTTSIVRWWPAAIVFAELMIYSALQAPVPGVNEPQYLGKAAHFWNPGWCSGDLFLESSNPHLFFYVVVGWLTRFLSLDATAWVSRVAGYALLATGWTALARTVGGSRVTAVFSAAIFLLLASIGNLSGEWLVGGIEGKVFAYGLLFFAISFWLERLPIAAGLSLGGAISFHPIVGGWGVAGIVVAELAMRSLGLRTRSYPPQTIALAGLGLLVTALPGAIPAAAILGGTTAHESATATFLQVFWRLRHHLDPTRFSVERYAGYIGLIAAWMCLVVHTKHSVSAQISAAAEAPHEERASRNISPVTRKTRFSGCSATSGENLNLAWALFVMATIAIAAAGIAAGWHVGSAWRMPYRDLRSTLLKFYPFRLADVFVPLAFSLAVSQSVFRLACNALKPSSGVVAALVLSAFALSASVAITLPDRNPSRMPPERLAAWKDVAAWSRDNTPTGTVIVTPSRLWGFKWFSHRGEFVNYKDSPQDATGLLEWKRRLDLLRDWWGSSETGRYSKQDLERLGTLTGSDYLITYAFPGRFSQTPLYDNGEFRVYSLR